MAVILLFLPVSVLADRGIDVSGVYSNDRRIALVIGNSAYKNIPLANPVDDADDMAAKLKKLGFHVFLGKNLKRKEMHKTIRKFGNDLKQGGVGLFYYAGHGMQVQGKNYLIPIGADIQSEDEVQVESIDAGSVLRKMEVAANTMNMVFLDACRDNPFARSFRSSFKGLAQMDAPSGSLIVYATAPGSVAEDGDGRNGIFTKNLLAYLETPGLPVNQMLMSVRKDVRLETNGKQTPWESSSLEGNFYFVIGSKTVDDVKLMEEREKLAEERLKLKEEREQLKHEQEQKKMASLTPGVQKEETIFQKHDGTFLIEANCFKMEGFYINEPNTQNSVIKVCIKEKDKKDHSLTRKILEHPHTFTENELLNKLITIKYQINSLEESVFERRLAKGISILLANAFKKLENKDILEFDVQSSKGHISGDVFVFRKRLHWRFKIINNIPYKNKNWKLILQNNQKFYGEKKLFGVKVAYNWLIDTL